MSNGKTLIIAEAGVNHNGDIELAKRLIDVAADAGADIVKFQTFCADRLATKSATKADYQVASTGAKESQYEMLRRLELSSAAHEILMEHCAKRNIEFFSTGFDIVSVDMLVSLGIHRLKVPSGELTNLPYLRHVGSLGYPLILSTGMATLGEIEAAIEILLKAGVLRQDIVVLHCNTEYPTPMSDVNLRAMQSIQVAFGVKVGYSDHTTGIEVSIAAVSMGACIIEKHFTLDRALPGPDHRASLEPDELKSMVQAIRNIELALGDGIKRPSVSEMHNKSIARKSIVAARDILAGEAFSADNLAAKRPGTGLSPMCWDEVIGRIAPRDFAIDELIIL
ncbi:N-acetylneuraminate synthase [Polynucleobacter sp. MG-Unter2-18]|uniref:N-acetylneuraminate synthase n=1 Tax=Polynucleobacter sp. MG-Unter2-18 TaxID=2081052 RepID=UPI001BFD08B3|nr:N-acetylneuraminate synthase [Polynucleobacter sp. MG-Unter2-18]QWD94857.1 N-acetylneuraminate synthase [Polynucleobacter sp. MG-Unter2-18]